MSARDKGLHIAIVGTGSAAFSVAIKAVEEGAQTFSKDVAQLSCCAG